MKYGNVSRTWKRIFSSIGQRDYSQMKAYYDKAMELYQKQENSDGEMLQLEAMMKELQAGKWFQSSGIEGR